MQGLNRKITDNTEKTKDIASKISNIINNLQFADENDKEYSLSSYIFYLLKAAENSDSKLKAEIENNIVKLGSKSVPHLIDSLMSVKGTSRGLAAMALIRIGAEATELLKTSAKKNSDFCWIADYILGEINGTQVSVTV